MNEDDVWKFWSGKKNWGEIEIIYRKCQSVGANLVAASKQHKTLIVSSQHNNMFDIQTKDWWKTRLRSYVISFGMF